MSNYFEGAEALGIVATVQDIVMEALGTKLNGPAYQASLGKPVTITPSEEQAIACYNKGAQGTPFVEITLESQDTQFARIKTPQGVKPGSKHNLTFMLDMSMSDHAGSQSGPAKFAASDRKLIDAVNAIIRGAYEELRGLKVYATKIRGGSESQLSATKRNPHTLTCLVRTLDE